MRMRTLLTILMVAITGGASALDKADLELVYSEDFENGLHGFDMTDSAAWKLEEDEGNTVLSLHQSSEYEPAVRSPLSIAWVQGLDVSDFVLEARLRQRGREYGHRDLCLFFGRETASRFYYVHIASEADPHAHSIFLVKDEPRVSIAKDRTDGADWGQGWHDVRIVRDTKAGRIEVYFDDMDTPIMVAEDASFTSGPIGFGSFDDVGWFDDIKIWAKPAK